MALTPRFRVEPIWDGATVVVIGGGPSLSLAQIRTVAQAKLMAGSNVRVIAVNDAVYPAWWADWLHACDEAWWRWNIRKVYSFEGVKTCVESVVPAPWVDGYLKSTGIEGFDPDPACIRNGGNSGYQAMHIAVAAGAARIVLIGFDMKPAGDAHHWFGNHALGLKPDYNRQMVPYFETLKPALEERGIEVVNATPGSALKTFAMADLSEVKW